MSRITDAVDAHDPDLEVPTRPSGLVAGSAARASAAEAPLRAGASLADALRAAFDEDAIVELVGFSGADAEPFAAGPAPLATVVAIVRQRLESGGAVLGALEPIWASHRGHAVWLHPGSTPAARLALALRIAEASDPARVLGTGREMLVALASAALADPDELEACLAPERLDPLVAQVIADAPSPNSDDAAAASVAPPLDPSALVLFDGSGHALVARALGSDETTGETTAIGLVDRAGRPFVLPRSAPSVAGWLVLLHQAIDRDAPAVTVLGAHGGVRLDANAMPELVAEDGAAVSFDRAES